MKGDQFKRKVSLVLVAGDKGLDLSEFHITFKIQSADCETPNAAVIRVYNLKEETITQIKGEFSEVILQAGYEDGNFGAIFVGTIKQFYIGRERNTDSFLDIRAADGDLGYNFGTLNRTLAAGSKPLDVLQAASIQLGAGADEHAKDTFANATGGILPRGKVMFGLARQTMGVLAKTHNVRWSMQNGKLVAFTETGFMPGEAPVLTSETGLIGVPVANEGGIFVKTLLNPLYRIGGLVQIKDEDIAGVSFASGKDSRFGYPGWTSTSLPASKSANGFYRIMSVDYSGDTRGQEWYADLICLDIDSTKMRTAAAQGASAKVAG